MTRLSWIALRISYLVFATVAGAQVTWGAGWVDRSFGSPGSPLYRPAESFVATVTALPDGRLAVVSQQGGGDCCAAIASVQWLDQSGREMLRRSELPRTLSPHPTASIARTDGGLMVGGHSETGGGFIVAFTADGSGDRTFGVDGVVTTPRAVTSIAIGPDGRLLYGDTQGLQRIGTRGEDPTTGYVCNCTVWGIWPEADGRVVLGAGEKLLRLGADHTPDPTFGPDGAGAVFVPGRQAVRRDDGGLYVATAVWPAVRLQSYDRDGRPVPGFGFGPDIGVLETRFSTTSLGSSNVGDVLRDRVAIATDGSRLYVTVAGVDYLSDVYPYPVGQFMARLLPSGRFDETFGRGGVVQLSEYSYAGELAGAADSLGNSTGIVALVPQPGGRLLAATSSLVFRLTGGDELSPGAIDSTLDTSQVGERGLVRLRLSRLAGSSLRARVRYETQDRSATAGADYLAASGIVEWASGNNEAKVIEITLLEDSIDEPDEDFAIVLGASEGTPLVFRTIHQATIVDDDPPPVSPPTSPPAPSPASGSSGSGGGGAGGPLEGILLASLAIACLWRRRATPLARIVALASIFASFAAGAAGKIDPTFGTPGTFEYRAPERWVQFLEVMPSGHVLVVATNGDNCCTDNDVVVRRLDPEGRLDTGFGSAGKVELPIGLGAGATALDPARRLIVGGIQQDGGGFVAAVTPDGQLDPSFADAGIRRLPEAVTALAVQPDGHLVVATEGTFVQDSGGNPVCAGGGWSIRRLSARGADDPTFGNAGIVTSTMAEGSGKNCQVILLWTQPDGRIVVASQRRTLRLEPDGSADATFGAGRDVPPPESQVTRNPDGSFAYILTDSDWFIGSAMLARFDRNGARLGNEVNLRLAYTLTGAFDAQDRTGWLRPVMAGDGLHYYVAFLAVRSPLSGPSQGQDTFLGHYVARLKLDGTLDTSFGEAGFVTLGSDSAYRVVPLDAGRSLVLAGNRVFRLTGADQPSPGRVQASPVVPSANESEGRVRIALGRGLGSDGPLRVRYSTASGTAIAGVDFVFTAGTIEWASGDTTQHMIEIPIVDDSAAEPTEYFRLEIGSTVGAISVPVESVLVYIDDNDVSPPVPPVTPPAPNPPAPTPPSTGGSGGGGRLGPAELALLAGLLAAMRAGGPATWRRRRPPRPAPAAVRPSGTFR